MKDMNEQTKKVVIIGGGITGLSAAFYMQKEAREKGLPLDVLLIEATNRLGWKNPDDSTGRFYHRTWS